jgi:lipopolysaccharide export system permease protein
MLRRLFHPLDRYVFSEFWRVFMVTAIGFPVLVEVLDLAENLDKYVDRQLPRADIALSYVYWLPESIFLVLPAAVLFATVFTIGSLTRHTELTAAKASGISFHRVIAPIFIGAAFATILGLGVGELSPSWNQKRGALLKNSQYTRGGDRVNFTHLAEDGRVYEMQLLKLQPPGAQAVQVERISDQPGVLNYIVNAKTGSYDTTRAAWQLADGVLHIKLDSINVATFQFQSLLDPGMKEQPLVLSNPARKIEDMGYRELGRYIDVMERTGAKVNEIRVERMLKIAIPVTCVIIVLFGAPLATTTQKGGPSYGIGISLAATVLFLLLINFTKAFGKQGVLEPEFAAWVPSILFGLFGALMLLRVRT